MSVDLTLALEYDVSKLPVQLTNLPDSVMVCLRSEGFHVVPAEFDRWRISFSMAEKQLLFSAPDGFKACYRVLKYLRDIVSDSLELDLSFVPSYIFKCVLLRQLFTTDEHAPIWGNNVWFENVERNLEVVLEKIKETNIQSFFISKYNLLSMTDHSNMLRQFVVEDMLNLVKGRDVKHTTEEVKEKKRQIRVLQISDVFDYAISSSMTGKDPSVLWRKMFVNIDDVPVRIDNDSFIKQMTDLDSMELDENVYRRLVEIWKAIEELYNQLINHFPWSRELKIVAHKFYIRTCEKRRHFERTHEEMVVEELPIKEVLVQFILKYADDHIDERGSNAKYFANLHKEIPPDFKSSGFLQDITSVTMSEGSEKGYNKFKNRMTEFFFQAPDSNLMSIAVGYVSQIFRHGKDKLEEKLAYIPEPQLELDLD